MNHGSGPFTFPSELEVALTRDFAAPIQLVFDVLTKAEHVRKTIAPFEEEVTTCEFDARTGGSYHYVFVTDDGREMSFRGDFLEVDPPYKTVATWVFEGWPGVEAIETMVFSESEGGTTLSWNLAFKDADGRAHMTAYDGIEATFDHLADYLKTLLNS